MPTSGEAKIHAASTYNLRSKPLPRTRSAVANKENVSCKTTTSRIPTKKSKLPVTKSTVTARRPPVSSGTVKTRSQTRVRTVPNFEKLHKNWQKKFHQGKAVDKRPCTQTREFDLTRHGTQFKRAYFSGDDHTDEEEVFEEDHDALQSILNNRGLGKNAITGRTTVATMGGSRQITRAPDHRQTLGALPSRYNSRANNALNAPSAAKIPRGRHAPPPPGSSLKTKQRTKSLVDEQEEFDSDIDFQEDNAALATILNDTGIQRHHPAVTRQTFAGTTQARSYQRTSIYYQKPKNENREKVYADFARLTIGGGTLSPTMMKLRGLDSSPQMLPRNATGTSQPSHPVQHQRVAMLNTTPGRSAMRRNYKTPGTASRVPPRQQISQDLSCSPALRVTRQPQSAMKMANSQSKSPRTVCWAEILDTPPMTTKDAVATALFADEEPQYNVPYNKVQKQQQKLNMIQADTSANRHKVEEMEAIELQLQQEIERLKQETVAVPTAPQSVPNYTAVPIPQQNQEYVASQPQHPIPTSLNETEARPSAGVFQQSFPSRPGPQTVEHAGSLFSPAQPRYMGQPVLPGTSSGIIQQSYPPRIMTPVVSEPKRNEESHSAVQHVSMDPMQGMTSAGMSAGFVQQSFQSRMTPVVSYHQQISGQQQNGLQSGMKPVNMSHQLTIEQPNSVQSHHYQLQHDNRYQRTDVVTSVTQQRHVLDAAGSSGYKSLQQGVVQNSAELDLGQVSGNQRVDTVLVERAQVPNSTSHLSNNLSQVDSVHGNLMQNKVPHHNSLFQDEAMNMVVGEPSTVAAEINQIPRPFQSVSQPKPSVIPSSSMIAPQTNNFAIGSMSTLHGLPLEHTKRHISGMPSGLPSTGGTPLQPRTYATKSTLPDSVIQTPHPVKPENHFKHQVMKQYTPAVPAKPQHHTLYDMPVPIQTPMAMRNVMLQGQKSGNGGRLVSPVAQMPTPVALKPANIDTRPPGYFAEVRAPVVEPKLKLDFENVEDTPSVDLSPSISRLNDPASIPETYTCDSIISASALMDRNSNQSVDLQTPGMRLKGQWNKNLAGQLFHETLLDEECALYTCRIQGKFSPKPRIERNFCNPIAKVLMEGDDMHFVPLASEFIHPTNTPAGSAFNSYAAWT